VNERLAQLQQRLDQLDEQLEGIGSTTAPAHVDQVVQALKKSMRARATDLRLARDMISEIRLPADPDQPIEMVALGRTWELELPRTAKDRTRAAALKGMKRIK